MNVRAAVIASGDDELAAAFLDHERLRHWSEDRRWWTEVDPSSVSAEDMDAERVLEDWRLRLLARHGDVFKGEYGWAHAHLVETYPSYAKHVAKSRRPKGPTLFDLSRSAGEGQPDLAEREIYYSRASAAIHGSPRSLGNFDETGALRIWSGPTVAYLGLAIDQASDDLAQLTNIYMSRMLDIDESGEADVVNLCIWRLSGLCKARALESHRNFTEPSDGSPAPA